MINYDHLEGEIAGTNEEIKGLADAIRSVCVDSPHEATVKIADSLSVELSQGKAIIRCEPARVIVRGSQAALITLAQNLDWLAAQNPTGDLLSPHLHLEHVPNHLFLDPASEPLLVSLKYNE